MKILCLIEADYVGYYDWVLGEAAGRIIEEGFTHIMDCSGNIIKVEIVPNPYNGEISVIIGEQINV